MMVSLWHHQEVVDSRVYVGDQGDQVLGAEGDVGGQLKEREGAEIGQARQEGQQEEEGQDDEGAVGGGTGKPFGLPLWQQRVDDLVAVQRVERENVEDGKGEIDGGEDRHQLRNAQQIGVGVQDGGQESQDDRCRHADQRAEEDAAQGHQQDASIGADARLPGVGLDRLAPAKRRRGWHRHEGQNHAHQHTHSVYLDTRVQRQPALVDRRAIT